MPLSTAAIDAIETELFALIGASGGEIPISRFTFRDAAGDAALRVLLPYQRLPVELRKIRIQVRRPYGETERVVSVVDLGRPAEWLRPERKAFKRRGRPRARGFVPGLALGDVLI